MAEYCNNRHNSRIPSVEERLLEWEAERDLPPNGRTAVYVSTPITTGPIFVEWMQTTGKYMVKDSDEYVGALKANVILPNIQRAASVIELFRWRHMGLIINPTALEVSGWKQSDYHRFWKEVLRRHARRVILLKGWQYSRGCTLEFELAQRLSIDCVDENMESISRDKGLILIRSAIDQIKTVGEKTLALEEICQKLEQQVTIKISQEREFYKDEVLNYLACTANVAQFVSFGPSSQFKQRFCRIIGYEPNHKFSSPKKAVRALLKSAPEKKVNIRSYHPNLPEGNPFIKNLKSPEKVMSELRWLAEEKQLYTIVNEVIDESDGGVSGVCYRGLIEFSPDSTPRCVDMDEIETAVFPFEIGLNILKSVYGFEPDLRGREGARIEFSIHPKRRGWNQSHTIIWQSEQRPAKELKTTIRWPNRFSRLLGDKAFGLLVATAEGFPVPRTARFKYPIIPFYFWQIDRY